jgi:hypothetical protein
MHPDNINATKARADNVLVPLFFAILLPFRVSEFQDTTKPFSFGGYKVELEKECFAKRKPIHRQPSEV